MKLRTRFIMACPACGKYVEAESGIFAKKTVTCECGNVIHVETDKMASRICPECGNNVVYDQENRICPVCNAKFDLITNVKKEEKIPPVELTCPTCRCHITANAEDDYVACPLCDTEIDVQARAAEEKARKQDNALIIKCEGDNDAFLWKHPIEDFPLGSQLIVREAQQAIFLKNGRALDTFGPGRYTLNRQSMPNLNTVYQFGDDADIQIQSEVYFVNMTTQMGIKWGTDSKVRMFDPGSGLYVELGACGNFNLRVADARQFLVRLAGTASEQKTGSLNINKSADGFSISGSNTSSYSVSYMTGKFKTLIMSKVKSNLARAIKEQNINILEIDERLDILSAQLRSILNEALEEYGLTMPEFYITSVMTPDDDPNFRRLKQQFAERTLTQREEALKKDNVLAAHERKMAESQSDAQLEILKAQKEAELLKLRAQAEADAQRLKAAASADSYRMQAMAEAEEMHAKGYSYQDETARQVGLEAMQNGITGANNPFSDMVSLGLTMGTMGSMVDMSKSAINGISAEVNSSFNMSPAQNMNNSMNNDISGWDCACGQKGITGKFCPECGTKKPEPIVADTWDCACGMKGLTGKFCPECGAKRPEPIAADTWDCVCGVKGLTGKFCPECGGKRPEPKPLTWTCSCGNPDITGKFCPECGAKRPE